MNEELRYTVAIDEAAQVEMTAAQIRNAHQAKRLAMATPIWRAGMDEWSTVEAMAGELGISALRANSTTQTKAKPVAPPLKRNKLHKICTSCGHIGKPERFIKGSFVIELLLWLIMLLPGFLYSLWRVSTRQDVCAVCKHSAIIPVDSPRGRALAEGGARE